MSFNNIVVVGASLAGARAAGALRRSGYTGAITLVGDEKHRAYERPPLSKQMLSGAFTRDDTFVDIADLTDVHWRLGTRAIGVDLHDRFITLDDEASSKLSFDGLVIATGATPRPLPGTEGIDGVRVLRTLDESEALRLDLQSNPTVVVVGGGFIGCEVAATCAKLGLNTTIVDPVPHLMSRGLGESFSEFFSTLHRSGGVTLRLGESVEGIDKDQHGRVSSVRLGGADPIDANVVVVGIGVVPNTGWLEGSGVAIDNGVVCDATCAVLDTNGSRIDGVVACGDVTRWHHELYGRLMRVEHWENATTMGEAAAQTLLLGPEDAQPFVDVPIFWSDQHGKKIQFAGNYAPGDQVCVVEGSIDDGKFVAAYGRDGVLVGALGVGRPAKIMGLRQRIAQREEFPPGNDS